VPIERADRACAHGVDLARRICSSVAMVEEAKLERSESGLRPAGAGWFVVNLAEAHWNSCEGAGRWCSFEGTAAEARFGEVGINVHVLEPGERNCQYHAEDAQESFLVLSGSCTLIVEGAERALVAGDFFHCPAWTRHVLVGSGTGPCAIVMVGARRPEIEIDYPVDRVALSHGAGVTQRTSDPKVAYADFPAVVPAPSPWPLAD
jgi:uncharacterized cupin superfamily protein